MPTASCDSLNFSGLHGHLNFYQANTQNFNKMFKVTIKTQQQCINVRILLYFFIFVHCCCVLMVTLNSFFTFTIQT